MITPTCILPHQGRGLKDEGTAIEKLVPPLPMVGKELNLPMQIHVDCYAGYRGEETPRFIILADNKIEVTEVLDRWLAPDHRYFKVLGDDRATYIIRHDTVAGRWELVFYQVDSLYKADNGNIGES